MSETTMQQSLFGPDPAEKAQEATDFDGVPFFEDDTENENIQAESSETPSCEQAEKAEEPDTESTEGKKESEPEAKEDEKMPELTGSPAEKAEQKLKWERAHMDDKKKESSVYDSLLAMLDPADNDRILTYLIEECRKDEAFANQVLLEHKSFSRCMKVFIDTFTKYFSSYGIANLQTTSIDGRDVPVGVATDEAGFTVVRGYYMLDDLEQVEKEKKEAAEKARKEAENKKKIAEAKAKKKTEKKADTKAKEEKKDESFLFSLFD